MGQGDLRQPRLRATPRAVEAVQHLFRYCTGHLLRANRGHRVVYTALRDLAYERGSLVHNSTDQAVLTKAELRELLDARQDLESCGRRRRRGAHDLHALEARGHEPPVARAPDVLARALGGG